jgi:DNA polymerase III sliding clamp (beta) subunit (PCNA family)
MKTFADAWNLVSRARSQQVVLSPGSVVATDGRTVASVEADLPISESVTVSSEYLKQAVAYIPEPKSFGLDNGRLLLKDNRRTIYIPRESNSSTLEIPTFHGDVSVYDGVDFDTMRHAVRFSNSDVKTFKDKGDAGGGDVIFVSTVFRRDRMYATNRYVAYEGFSGIDVSDDIVVPLEASRDLAPMFDGKTSSLSFDGRNLGMNGGDVSFMVPTLDKKYPNVARVIRKPDDGVVIEGEALVKLKDAVSEFRKLEKKQYIRLMISSDSIIVASIKQELMGARESIPFSSEETITTTFYVQYLYTALLFADMFMVNRNEHKASYGESDLGERFSVVPCQPTGI